MTHPASHFEQTPTLDANPVAAGSTKPEVTLGRLIIMGLIISAFLLAVNAFVCATASSFFDLPGWPRWQVIPGVFPIAFILTTILGFRLTNPLLRAVYSLSAAWLGFLNFAFFAAIACWIVDLPDWLAGWPLPRFALAAVLYGLAVLVTIYGLINAASLRVTRVTIPLPNLPEAWIGHTIALVTDLHLGHISGPKFLHRVLSRLRLLQPDAVLISGDMFDGTPLGLDHLAAPWRDYSAPRGVYFVTGNHDEFADRSIYINAVQRTGVRVLNNEKISLHGLQIVGVHDSEVGDPALLRKILREVKLDPTQPSILVVHRPENLSVSEAEGISLQLSGHTHGGQLWPWSLLVSRIYGRFAHGLQRLNKLQVFTSYGVGTWGPPLRVATRSEIILIRLEKATNQD